jgi:hypothetical protein
MLCIGATAVGIRQRWLAFLDFPYRRLGWISQFELDRGLAENADDSGIPVT